MFFMANGNHFNISLKKVLYNKAIKLVVLEYLLIKILDIKIKDLNLCAFTIVI